jgi:hypothetical protein
VGTEQVTKNLESAWQALLREHPDLANLPDPDRRPPNEESLDALAEQGCQFDANEVDFWAHAEANPNLDKWIDNLDEPDKTIFVLYRRDFSFQTISDMLKWQGVWRSKQGIHSKIQTLKRKLLKTL